MSEDEAAAPQDLGEKLQVHRSDGRPARRRLASLQRSWGYRVEETASRGRKEWPVVVSHRPMDARSFWRLADSEAEKNPWFEFVCEAPESAPRGEQWQQA